MFKLKSIEVKGFWGSRTASATFHDDVNIIIGRNGTGKTTFMNIVHAVLTVDADALYQNPFASAVLVLSDGAKTRTIRANLSFSESSLVPAVVYHISNRRFEAQLVVGEDLRKVASLRYRRAGEELQKIREELGRLVSVASLSVYRIGGDGDPESRDRMPRRISSNVDSSLLTLMQRLTQYQLELSNSAREISSELQRNVLTSLLYTEVKDQDRLPLSNFDEGVEKQNLVAAYRQLGVSGSEVTRKIQEHISAVGSAIKHSELWTSTKGEGGIGTGSRLDFGALEAFRVTRSVVAKSLEAEGRIKFVFSQVELFLETLKKFIADKAFSFASGELTVATEGPIPLAKLSSGEKQLLILLVETLLQRKAPFIFLADEPELSLHIAWQRNILSAIRSLNPNAQIVVATHSPEIAGKFRGALLDMEDLLGE